MHNDILAEYEDILQPLIVDTLELGPRQISILTRVFVDARAQMNLTKTASHASVLIDADMRNQADASLRSSNACATPRPK